MRKKTILIAVLMAALVAVGGVIAAHAANARTTVVRVIDGDTLIVRLDGKETTVRLLNIDTPETKHPEQAVECLGPEATGFLERRLPAGTVVELQYDIERTDRYGRTLAGVFESGSLVNAEIAANGLGVAVAVEPNRRFFADVKASESAARSRGQGLFDVREGCTIPAQWATLIAASPVITTTGFDTSTDVNNAILTAGAALAEAERALTGLVAKGRGLSVEAAIYRIVESENLTRYNELLTRTQTGYQTLLDESQRLTTKERHAAEKKEREARRNAERAANEKAQRAAKERAQRAAQKNTQRTKPGATKKKPGKYNGPRCYAPGGKTWRPC